MKLFLKWAIGLQEDVFCFFSSGGHFIQRSRMILVFCFLFFFSSGGHFIQRSRMILAILVEGHSMNISVKLF